MNFLFLRQLTSSVMILKFINIPYLSSMGLEKRVVSTITSENIAAVHNTTTRNTA
jgi:hypothetical protein